MAKPATFCSLKNSDSHSPSPAADALRPGGGGVGVAGVGGGVVAVLVHLLAGGVGLNGGSVQPRAAGVGGKAHGEGRRLCGKVVGVYIAAQTGVFRAVKVSLAAIGHHLLAQRDARKHLRGGIRRGAQVHILIAVDHIHGRGVRGRPARIRRGRGVRRLFSRGNFRRGVPFAAIFRSGGRAVGVPGAGIGAAGACSQLSPKLQPSAEAGRQPKSDSANSTAMPFTGVPPFVSSYLLDAGAGRKVHSAPNTRSAARTVAMASRA